MPYGLRSKEFQENFLWLGSCITSKRTVEIAGKILDFAHKFNAENLSFESRIHLFFEVFTLVGRAGRQVVQMVMSGGHAGMYE